MATNRRRVQASPDAVFAVPADGWAYAQWVVGAARIRAVDDGFPQPGTHVHHSIGVWPLLLSDTTAVESWDPPRQAVLTARAWPTGAARVVVRCEPVSGGTDVTIWEDAVAGPQRLVPKPLRTVALSLRNRESLRRLALLAEGRETD